VAGPAAGEHDLALFPSLVSRLLSLRCNDTDTRLLLPAAASLSARRRRPRGETRGGAVGD
jgi:hypothetical protein